MQQPVLKSRHLALSEGKKQMPKSISIILEQYTAPARASRFTPLDQSINIGRPQA
jgi:hypothetical protein